MRVLSPRLRRGPRFPWWTGAGLGLWALGFALAPSSGILAELVTLTGVASACGLAGWVETHFYYRQRARSRQTRLPLDFRPLLVIVLALPLLISLDQALAAAGYPGSALLVGTVGVVWFLSAHVGSSLIIVLDAWTRLLLASFRARVRALVLVLLAIASVVSVSIAPKLLDLLNDAPQWTSSRVIGPLAARILSAPGIAELSLGGSSGVLFVFAVTLLVGLPSVSSATAKFAGLVMERVYPLSSAFDAVAKGERDVRVEAGGSSEFAQLGDHFNRMVETLSQAEKMERAFGSYVSTQLLDRIRAQHDEATLAVSTRDASVFFADIRNFTGMSERLAAEDVALVLNMFFSCAVEVVDAHDGYLNKFLGDALMVVFNGPLEQPDHCARSARCAIALQDAVTKLNRSRAFPSVGAIDVGVGIASGPMVCGNIGSARQMEYTVIGDVVNTASRLCSQAAGGEVWMTRRTASELPPDIRTRVLQPVQVKGKKDAVEVMAWPA